MKSLVLTLLLGVVLSVPAAAEGDDRLATIHLPEGFVIETFADVPNARQMAWGEKGTLFVGTRREGRVFAMTDEDSDGRGERMRGVAFRDGALYVAAVSTILRFDDIESRLDDPRTITLCRSASSCDPSVSKRINTLPRRSAFTLCAFQQTRA